ncbi:MAG: hypothetical protein K2X38_20595 [Gemmataceae bacterium]|nr:hypothetical protein [Gemmataceae bacterium]
MRRPYVALALCVALMGCGSPPEKGPDAVAVTLTKVPFDLLSGKDVVDLGALLQRPRQELAAMAGSVETKLTTLERCRQEGSAPFLLLPDARFPLTVPVFRQAAWSDKHGVSVPDDLKDADRDSAVSWHLARHGDFEAAAKFGDTATLEKYRVGRNYPLEWTRLVGLHLLHAEYRVASDEKEGAATLIGMHRQLRELLPEAVRKSPLGQTLLTRGLGVLKDAAKAYRERGRGDLADQVDRFFAGLETPTWTPELPNHLALADWLDASTDNTAVQIANPDRLLDLLALDLPFEGIDAALVFVGKDRKAAEVVLAYGPTLSQWHTPDQLAPCWKERGVGTHAEAMPEFRRVTYRFGAAKTEMVVTPAHALVGALVRVTFDIPATTPLPRDFGIVHLDRGFEHGRRLIAWKQRQSSVTADTPALAAVRHPFAARLLAEGKLEREDSHDLVRKATFILTERPKQRTTLGQVAAEGWRTFGPADIEMVPASRSIHLVWNDGKTRLALQFPAAQSQAVVLEAASVHSDLALRKEAATKRDAEDRATRLAEGKPVRRVQREVDGFRLGMTKAEFAALLPRSPQMHVRDIPGGVVAAFVGSPKSPAESVVRQWSARFDDAGRAVEVRVRYDGPAARIVDGIKAKLGPAEALPIDATTWKELPASRPESRFGWHDDMTLLVVTQSGSTELILRDCPLEHAAGVALPPLAYLPGGTSKVQVGMSLADLQKLGAAKLDDGYFVAVNDPHYDGYMAWFAGDRAIRVLARHRIEGKELAAPDRAMQALLAAWSRDAATLGWPVRQDFQGPHVQSWATLDDVHRVRIFCQEQESEQRLFTEWKLR